MESDTIVIAGGGVAGALLAILLAREGRRVVVVERRSLGKTKCCGGCLAPRGVRQLCELGLEDTLEDADAPPTRHWRLRGDSGGVLIEASLGSIAGAVVARDRFDTALLDHAERAGALILREASVQLAADGVVSIRRHDGEVRDRLRPWLLIGADGVGSGVARAAGLAASPTRSARLGFSWQIEESAASELRVEPQTIEIHLAKGGYLGLAHEIGRAHV